MNFRRFSFFLSLALLALPVTVQAHAIIVDSQPKINAEVIGPDVDISLRYNSRIDHQRSRVILIAPDKSQTILPINKTGALDRVETKANGLTAGEYHLRWQVLSADSHITRGDIPFTIKPTIPTP